MASDTKDLVQTASEVRVQLRHQKLEAQKLEEAFAKLGLGEPWQAAKTAGEALKVAIDALEVITAEKVLS